LLFAEDVLPARGLAEGRVQQDCTHPGDRGFEGDTDALNMNGQHIHHDLKDLRVVDKHLTLEQLTEQTRLSKSDWVNMKATSARTSVPLHLRNGPIIMECLLTIC
jgi:hypothetical protein